MTPTRSRWQGLLPPGRQLLCGLLVAASGRLLVAGDYASLYDDATLKQWEPPLRANLLSYFENAILPYLTPEEQRRLREVKIECPPRGPQGQVVEYYTRDGTVVMPVLSMRFFGDLALAYAWLEEHKFNPATVQEYVGMIRYKSASDFSGGKYPRPLDALQIPSDARDSPRVKDSLNKSFATAMIFVLSHELGHVYHRHRGYDGVVSAEARVAEEQADQFALEIMRRTGTIPLGVPLWFLLATSMEYHRADFTTEAQWQDHLRSQTHPLTASRVESLAAALEKSDRDFARAQDDRERGLVQVRYVADQIRNAARLLKNEGVFMVFRSQSLGRNLEMLAPRHGAAYEVGVQTERAACERPFCGLYECKIWSKGVPVPLNLKLVLRREGTIVTGDYSYAGITGTLRGKLSGTTLDFEWREADSRGTGSFQSDSDGASFKGEWRSAGSLTSGGTWEAKRVSREAD
jgi:hypothetical protein